MPFHIHCIFGNFRQYKSTMTYKINSLYIEKSKFTTIEFLKIDLHVLINNSEVKLVT